MRFCLSARSWRLYSSCSRSCCSWSSCWRRSASERSLFSCCSRMKSRRRVDSPGTLTMELHRGGKFVKLLMKMREKPERFPDVTEIRKNGNRLFFYVLWIHFLLLFELQTVFYLLLIAWSWTLHHNFEFCKLVCVAVWEDKCSVYSSASLTNTICLHFLHKQCAINKVYLGSPSCSDASSSSSSLPLYSYSVSSEQ